MAPDNLLAHIPNTGQQLETAYTYADVARLMQVTKQTVYGWVKRGQFTPPTYLNGNARFAAAAVRLHLATGLKPPGTYTAPDSLRAEVGRIGQAARQARSGRRRLVKKGGKKK